MGLIGTYILFIELDDDLSITLRKKKFLLPVRNNYVYVGSALGHSNGLKQRITRHLRPINEKKIHWHIDQITASSVAHIFEVLAYPSSEHLECKVLQILLQGLSSIYSPIPGFGSSDCKAKCPAHLLTSDLPNTVFLNEIRSLLSKTGYPFLPWTSIMPKI